MIRGFQGLGSQWSADRLGTPWGDQTSILTIVREHLDDDGRLTSAAPIGSTNEVSPSERHHPLQHATPHAAESVPEMPALPGSSDEALLWVPGARDGILGSDVEDDEAAAQAARIYTTLRRLLVLGGEDRAAEFYNLLLEFDAVSCVDSLLTLLIEDERFSGLSSAEDTDGGSFRDRLRAVALWVVQGAPDPEPVKIGLALFGLCAEREDLSLLSALGAHEELTLYAAVAIDNAFVDADPLLWDLAQQVYGWGRIQAVERLSETRDEAVKAWLVREGFRNSIANGYLALTCAEAGGLVEQLEPATIDEDLLNGAAGIIVALCDAEGPAKTLDYYPAARLLVERFLGHLERWRPAILGPPGEDSAPSASELSIARAVEPILAAVALQRFLSRDETEGTGSAEPTVSLVSIRDALSESREPAADAPSLGWSDEVSADFHRRLADLLASSLWKQATQTALDRTLTDRSGREQAELDDFDLADAAAQAVGLDTWDLHAERVRSGSSWEAPASWGRLFATEDPDRLARAVRLAEERFSAPAGKESDQETEPGPIDEQELHAVLEALEQHPGLSWPLITVGLGGKSLSLRVVAARALGTWPRDSWPLQGEFLLRKAFKGETSGEVRGLLNELFAG